jgi:hypothetical protein
MNSVRYIGMDVHRDTISVAVLDEQGRLMMQSVLATRAAAILDFIHGVAYAQKSLAGVTWLADFLDVRLLWCQ